MSKFNINEFFEKMEKKEDCGIHNPEIGRWKQLGLALDMGLSYAKKSESLDSEFHSMEKTATKSFLKYLTDASNPEKIVDVCELPLIVGNYIDNGQGIMFESGITKAISYNEISIRINDYILNGKDNMPKDKFNRKYGNLIKNCKETAEDILRVPDQRLNIWQGEESYKNLMDNFKMSESCSWDF